MVRSLGCFFCGVVFAINLGELIPTNPEYGAAWWKVVLSVLLFLFVALSREVERRKKWDTA